MEFFSEGRKMMHSFAVLHFELMIPKHQQINVSMNMSETPEKKKARLRYDNAFKTAWTDEFQ
jgi:hypothetical protein